MPSVRLWMASGNRNRAAIATLLDYLSALMGPDRAPVRSSPIDLDWEIVVYVGLWRTSTKGVPDDLRRVSAGILRHLPRLLLHIDALPGRSVDISLGFTALFLFYRLRDRLAVSREHSDWMKNQLLRHWRWAARDAQTTDHNDALRVCNLLGATNLTEKLCGPLGALRHRAPSIVNAVVRRFTSHWRREYRTPPHAGRHHQATEDAVYFMSHCVFAWTRWGSAYHGHSAGGRLRPEREYAERLLRRPSHHLLAEVGHDPATEVIVSALALGVAVPAPGRRRDALYGKWRAVRRDNLPQDTHWLQHMAVNLLFALRVPRCPPGTDA
jgi:hypothetical protein